MDLSKIKSEKLKKLLEKSIKFQKLPAEEKNKKIQAIERLPVKIQDEVICAFFEEENKKEQLILQKQIIVLKKLLEQLQEFDAKIKKFSLKDFETKEDVINKQKQKKLLEKLDEQ